MRTHVFSLLAVAGAMACSGKPGSGFGDGGPGSDGGLGGDGECGFACTDASSGGDSGGGCSPNPANFDIPGNGCDDDGDGTVDNPQGTCDGNLQLAGPAADFAKAIGLCKMSTNGSWGLVSATYTNGYNSTSPPADANQHGILTKFGNKIKPRQGASFGVLSSGWATEYDQCNDPQGVFKGGCEMDQSYSTDTAPPGYPKAVGSCNPSTDIYDAMGLTLKIKVPANAKGFAFDFDFFSGEWPEWVCSTYNDSFVAWLQSAAYSGTAGDLNISFDTNKNPINVNNAFFQVCSPANATVGCIEGPGNLTDACKDGDSEIQGTGFYDPGGMDCSENDSGGGATSWLTTQAPVQPGETITLQFIIWDTGDGVYDSSVLIDNWQWQASDTTVVTHPVN